MGIVAARDAEGGTGAEGGGMGDLGTPGADGGAGGCEGDGEKGGGTGGLLIAVGSCHPLRWVLPILHIFGCIASGKVNG